MPLFDFLKRNKKKTSAGREANDSSGQPVYLISAPMVWSAHVESYLEERDVPYLKRGRKGAALAVELGATTEIYDYYIPREAVAKASPGIDELRERIGFQKP